MEEDTYARAPRMFCIEKKGNKMEFKITNTDTSMVNGLRRMIMAETPTVAIQLVKIHLNTTYLCDEYIAHRLALIPLDCKRCPDFSDDDMTTYRLHVKYPKKQPEEGSDLYEKMDKDTKTIAVDSNDLEWIDGTRIYPVDYRQRGVDPIHILQLGERQEICLECTAIRNIGKFHAKWNPTCECVFRTYADIKINNEKMNRLTEEQRMEFVACCPRKVFECSGMDKKVILDNVEECIFCDECLVYASDIGMRGLVTVVPKTDEFLFKIEGTGVYATHTIVKKALEEMKKKFEILRSELNPQNK